MAILLTKGANTTLKEAGIYSDFFKVGVSWCTEDGQIDIDASAFLIDAQGKVINDLGFIFYNQAKSQCGSLQLISESNNNIDHCTFSVNTSKIPLDIQRIAFALSIEQNEKSVNFNQLEQVVIRLSDDNNECVNYELSDICDESSVIMGELYRHNGEFKFRAVGQGFNEGLGKLAEHFGVVIENSDSTPEIIDDSIRSHLRVINESIGIARKSKNRDTQLSRLRVAEDCLKRAKIASSVGISGFDEAEAEIKRIYEAINGGTSTEIVGMQHIDIDAEYSSEARTLLKRATELKKEKKYVEACEKLREAYSADGSVDLMIEERLRLPMYLQLAGKNDEGWNELNHLLEKCDDQFSKPIIENQIRIFLKKEKNETATNPVRVIFNENSNKDDKEKKGLFKTIAHFFKKPETETVINLRASDLQDSTMSDYFDDLVVGLEFHATLQLRTPLRVLSRDGEVYTKNDGKQPKIAIEQWEGIWIPKLKPFSELGLKEPPEGTAASDIGQVCPREYLPFLIDIRKIVELDDTIDIRINKLFHHPQTNEWMFYVNKHGGIESLSKKFFPLFLDTIPKLNNESIERLKELGLETPNAIAQTHDDVFIGINGIGKAKLKTIRDYCSSITKNRDSNRIDTVTR